MHSRIGRPSRLSTRCRTRSHTAFRRASSKRRSASWRNGGADPRGFCSSNHFRSRVGTSTRTAQAAGRDTSRNAAVTQNQTGPFQCRTNQSSNANDVFVLFTSGHGHIGQFADQNGTTQPNNCDTTGGGCVAETAIVNGVITTPPRTAPSPAVEENPRRNTTNANDRLTTDSDALGRV